MLYNFGGTDLISISSVQFKIKVVTVHTLSMNILIMTLYFITSVVQNISRCKLFRFYFLMLPLVVQLIIHSCAILSCFLHRKCTFRESKGRHSKKILEGDS